jgi:PAS domain S-box-containing protein
MSNLLLMIAHALALGLIVLALHYITPRFGFAPLLVGIGGIAMLLQTQPGMYIQPFPDIILYYSSTVLVPTVLVAVLIVYIANGAVPARIIILCVIGISIFLLLFVQVYRDLLLLPGTQSGSVLTIGQMVNYLYLNPRVVIASILAFTADLFVVSVFYQGIKNHARVIPEWLAIGVALLVALWVDAIIFNLVADFGNRDFARELPGDIVAKTVSAAALWIPTAIYLTRIAPQQPNFLGGEGRPLFDLLFGSPQEIKVALVKTERALHDIESARQRDASYFRQITENVSEALWLSDGAQRTVLYVNPAYERIWGRSAATMMAGMDAFVASLHPEDRERVLAMLPQQRKGDYEVEYRILRPDGTVRWIRDRAYPVRDEKDEVVRITGICTDITESKRAEKERLELAVEKERVRVLRDFVAEATHDLKTPLSSINLKIHQLSRLEDPAQKAQVLEEVKLQSARMGKMISDMLTLSRLESLTEFTLSRTDVNSLLRDICQRSSTIARQKDISIVQMLNDQVPQILADRDDLQRALSNLVENAVYYTPNGGRVQVQSAVNNGDVVLRVSDTGIGIPQGDVTHIFERFYRAPNARDFDPGGTGLGLAIVKKVVEQHHGRIEVNSEVGAGTQFTIYLPRFVGMG